LSEMEAPINQSTWHHIPVSHTHSHGTSHLTFTQSD